MLKLFSLEKKMSYSEKDIKRFAGLQGIRKKAAMYIGQLNNEGLFTLLREPADNAVDLALQKQNNFVHIIEDSEKNNYWIVDEGSGIPTGQIEIEDERGRKEKLSALYVVTGLTHSGKNFDSENASRGTHGIGIKATNAMSKTFEVWSYREKSWHCIKYENTKLVQDVKKCKAPVLPHGIKLKNQGTVVKFSPDLSLFEKGSRIDLAEACEWAKLSAYLVPKLNVHITNKKGKTKKFFAEKGLSGYLAEKAEKMEVELNEKMFLFQNENLDVAVQFSDAEGCCVDSYTNGLLNSGGGEHLKALIDSFYKTLQPFKGKDPFTKEDIVEGLIGLVNFTIAAPKFNNQVKEKLIDDRVYPIATEDLQKALTEFWEKNKTMAKNIVSRASDLRKKTTEFLKSKKLIKNVNSAKAKLSTKLADVQGNIPREKTELFCVEGDSAGGLAKQARDRTYQAVFPLKGKPLNVMEAPIDKILNNVEVASILAGIGVELNGKDVGKIRYGKIILLADADVDGKHISTLLLTLLWKFVPNLFHEKKVYIVDSPEYMARYKGKLYTAKKKDTLYKKTGNPKLEIQHIKGWGEINAEDLEPIAFNPETRKLIQVLAPENKDGELRFQKLMGKNSLYRKKLMGVE